MKQKLKRIVRMAALSLISFSALSFTTAHADLATTSLLKQGMNNSQVSELQTDLKDLGYFTYPSITGYFGSITAQAVESYQTAYQLQADGIVGPMTATSINHAMVKKQIVADTNQYVGDPYYWGGTSPSGFDCSGFVYYMYHTHGVTSIPRTSSPVLYTMGMAVDRAHLEPGDLVFYSLSSTGTITHVGIYLGNNQFMSATSSKGIYAYSMDNPYWSAHYVGAKRLY